MLIGGLAVGVWAEPRATKDCDVSLRVRASPAELLDALLNAGLEVLRGDLARAYLKGEAFIDGATPHWSSRGPIALRRARSHTRAVRLGQRFDVADWDRLDLEAQRARLRDVPIEQRLEEVLAWSAYCWPTSSSVRTGVLQWSVRSRWAWAPTFCEVRCGGTPAHLCRATGTRTSGRGRCPCPQRNYSRRRHGHKYAKRRLARPRIPFEALDNGLLSCSDPRRAPWRRVRFCPPSIPACAARARPRGSGRPTLSPGTRSRRGSHGGGGASSRAGSVAIARDRS